MPTIRKMIPAELKHIYKSIEQDFPEGEYAPYDVLAKQIEIGVQKGHIFHNGEKDVAYSICADGCTNPSKVQRQVIPAVLAKKDIIVRSQTGSGKTAAFAIPIGELVDWEQNKPQALVLTPTRELAVQVREDMFHIGRFKRLKVAAI